MATTLRIPVQQFRSLPAPTGPSKAGLFFAPVKAVPAALWDWRDVNPREVNQRSAVFKAIVATLTDEPERFHERNRGLTLSADEVVYDNDSREVVISLARKSLHGVIDGGHTLRAILDVQENLENDSPPDVFIKVMTGVEPDQIAEIAGGLNRSQQVDLKSLENLKAHFSDLQVALKDEPYASKIAYMMNEAKPIDVRDVLYHLAVFDCNHFDDNRHPTRLFGRKEGIVRQFADEARDPSSSDSFRILITQAPDILRLRDLIEKKTLETKGIGQYKAGKRERIKSKKHRRNELHFLGESVDGKVHLGWIMPMLGGFRANVQWDAPKGSFSWKVPYEELLDACLENLVACVLEIHQRENSRPEYVGRNATAWRLCYGTVQNAILEHQLAEMRQR